MNSQQELDGLELWDYLTQGHWNRADRLRLHQWLRFRASRQELAELLERIQQLRGRNRHSFLEMMAEFGGALDLELIQEILNMGTSGLLREQILNNPEISPGLLRELAAQYAKNLCQRAWREDHFGKRLLQMGSEASGNQLEHIINQGIDPGEKTWNELWEFIQDAIQEGVFARALSQGRSGNTVQQALWLLLACPELSQQQLLDISQSGGKALDFMTVQQIVAHPGAGPRLWDFYLEDSQFQNKLEGQSQKVWLRSGRAVEYPPVRKLLAAQEPELKILKVFVRSDDNEELAELVERWAKKFPEQMIEVLERGQHEVLSQIPPDPLTPALKNAPPQIRRKVLRLVGQTEPQAGNTPSV